MSGFSGLFSGGMLKNVGYVAGGFIGTPFLEAYINKLMPTMTDATMAKVMRYAVKIGSAWLLSFGVGKVAGKEAGQKVLIGGLANVAITAIKDSGLLTGLTGGTTTTAGRYLGMGSQPLLGMYPAMGANLTRRTASRLDPGNRF